MQPWQSWAVVLLGGALAWYYYTSRRQPRPKGRTNSITDKVDTRKGHRQENSSKTRRPKEDKKKVVGDGNDSAVNTSPVPHSTTTTTEARADGQSSRNMSTASSSTTTAGDADDDLSPVVSPSLEATSGGSQVSGNDVSDMLEGPPPGPSVLRIIESTQPAKPSRPQQPKPSSSQPTETKKQRQNRKKAEERKAVRQEAEAERRARLEKQLRTAREAEGRPAKNGMGGTSSSTAVPASSVWNSHKHAMTTSDEDTDLTPAADTADRLPLLDTFNGDITTNKNNNQSSKNWHEPLMSEEEQMRMINELDDNAGWNTVSKGKKTRKNRTTTNGQQESSESESRLENSTSSIGPTSDSTAASSTQAIDKPMGGGQWDHQDPRGAVDASLKGHTTYRHPADSDWAVL
ncbi:MAG: hypothetical protein M1816_005029 [Peltula sp. TS41687]|nr:MAG: hypothetical protein M1816_005029 [Peltula sp. TS41687]